MYNVSNTYACLSVYVFLVVSSTVYWLFLASSGSNYIDLFTSSSIISVVSLFYFLNLFIAGFLSKAIWTSMLPLVILTVPNAINDLIPAFYLNDVTKRSSPSLSVITHIDLYLLLGLRYVKFSNRHNSATIIECQIIIFLVFITLFSNFIGLLYYNDKPYFLYFNLTQLRYLLLAVLIKSVLENLNHSIFRAWLLIGVLLVLFEAMVFSNIYGRTTLTSGNFGTNTLATTLSFIFLWLLVGSNDLKIRSCAAAFGAILILAWLTDTRAVAVSLVLALIAFGFLGLQLSGKVLVLSSVSFFGSVIVLQLGEEILDILSFVTKALNSYENARQAVNITETTSSIVTRLSMWFSAWNMLQEYPFGTGYSGWHYLSDRYGVVFTMFIDPHNDYLFSLINYGIVASFVYFYVIYFLPLKKYSKRGNKIFLIPILFVMSANLTNSNFYKHQFFILFLIFIISGDPRGVKRSSNNVSST